MSDMERQSFIETINGLKESIANADLMTKSLQYQLELNDRNAEEES